MADESKTPPEKAPQLQIALDESVAQGVYANLAMVNHNHGEFCIDFIFVQPQAPKAKVMSRVITNPPHFKRLVAAMADNLAKYEAKFGVIDVSAPQPNLPVH